MDSKFEFNGRKYTSSGTEKMREKLKNLNNPEYIELFEYCIKEWESLYCGLMINWNDEASENIDLRRELSKWREQQKNGRPRILKENDIKYITNRKNEGFSNRAIAKMLNVNEITIRRALKRVSY